MDLRTKLILSILLVLIVGCGIRIYRLEGKVDQLQANLATQVAAYNHLAWIVGELERRLGIPPANERREQ